MTCDILGIDVAQATFDVALRSSATSEVPGHFANTAEGFRRLLAWLKRHRVEQLHACLEATGRYGEALATFLYQAGYTVSVVNPACIHAYAQSKLLRNKPDRADAKLIADFCATQLPPAWPGDRITNVDTSIQHFFPFPLCSPLSRTQMASACPAGSSTTIA